MASDKLLSLRLHLCLRLGDALLCLKVQSVSVVFLSKSTNTEAKTQTLQSLHNICVRYGHNFHLKCSYHQLTQPTDGKNDRVDILSNMCMYLILDILKSAC